MEQLMESPAGSRGASATHKPTLKILAACENREGFLHSWWMQQQVEVCCGKEVEIARAFWCFALLRNEAMRRHAAREAAEAAMIVLALHGKHELPPHVRQWVNGWPVQPQAGKTALVVLLEPRQETGEESPAEVDYLRDIAASRRFDFYCNRSGWERPETSRVVFHKRNGKPPGPARFSWENIEWQRGRN